MTDSRRRLCEPLGSSGHSEFQGADIDAASFRLGMSQLAGAVSIVATGVAADPATWRGMTATAVCSLCPEPPSLIASLHRMSGTFQRLQCDRLFSVNILSRRHLRLARTFAGLDRPFGAERFGPDDWAAGTLAVPVLISALASFECRVAQLIKYGTHCLLIGDIETARWVGGADGDSGPLIYYRRRFCDIIEIEPTPDGLP
jgi:flavin reductase (DIM6/NTAB) family NADH-FMN oxidoreductase RutF